MEKLGRYVTSVCYVGRIFNKMRAAVYQKKVGGWLPVRTRV